VKTVEREQRTRERVLRLLIEEGPRTAAALAEELGLSPAGVRRHLDALVTEGDITAAEPRSYGPRGRGRPAKVYAPTDTGHSAGPQGYDDLALAALRHLEQVGGPSAVAGFAVARAARMEARYSDAGTPEELAARLSLDGYSAGVRSVPTGATLCQHHCPVQAVAADFPQLCEAETAALGRLLGTHVQRLATLARGDGVCTTHIPSHLPNPARTAVGGTA